MPNITATYPVTMTSLELVALINSERKEGRKELRHDNFMVKIEKHPGIDSPKFLGQYKDSTGRALKCYHLPEREAKLMVMSESLEVQTKVYDRMTALEAVQPPAASTLLMLEQQAAGIVQANMTVAALFQVPLHLAQIESVKSARLKTGVDFAPLLLVSPAQDNIADTDVMLEPRELAKHYKVPAHEMNLMLAKHGLQAGGPGNWHATDKGKAISSRHAWNCGTKSGYNLKWNVAAVRAVVK